MFTPSKFASEFLEKYNANYRLRHRSASFIENEQSGRVVIDKNKPGPGIVCEIVDLTTMRFYASAEGATETEALDNACRAAIDAPKPLTPAQAASARQDDEINKLRAENDALKKQLSEKKPPERSGDSKK